MTKKLLTIFALLSLSSFALVGCDDGDPPETDAGPPIENDAGPPIENDAGPPIENDAGPPTPMPLGMDNPPTLGSQIDRAGRPAVTSALIGTYTMVDDTARDGAKDAYNADSDPSAWAANYTEDIANNLGVLDGVDRDCGNQLLAGMNPTADRYDALAGVLAADYLLLNSANACTSREYLGVEAVAVGVPGVPADDCGGRVPTQDIIERSYSVLVAGALSGIDDMVSAPDDAAHNDDTFPFLAAPL